MKTAFLTFDDAVISHLSVAAPLLKEFGFGATFFICEWPGDSVYQLSWAQVRELEKMGFEIGNHTAAHSFMPETPAEKAEADIVSLEQKMADCGLAQPVSFAYPGGAETCECREILARRGYKVARTIREAAVRPGLDDPLSTGSFVIKEGNDNFNKAMAALTDDTPVVLTWHGVPEFLHLNVQTSIHTFIAQLKYLKEHDIVCRSLRDIV